MPKIFSFGKTASVLFYTIIFFVPVFAQNNDLRNELKSSFNDYKLIRLNKKAVLEKAQTRQTLTIQTIGANYELLLTARDLRPARFRAEETTAEGVRALPRNAVTTFKGTIVGETVSQVRLTIDENNIEGYFSTPNSKFFIEPARRYAPSAKAEDFIVYQENDLVKNDGYVCESELGAKIERGEEIVQANRFQAAQSFRVLEIGTEADYAFVSELGGAANANSEILSILNLVEGSYEAELGLTFDVVFQHAWSTPDPFDGSSANILNSFRTFWNVNYPQSSVPRDLAHLFTSRQNLSGRGSSYLGTICASPNSAYGYTGRLDVGTIKYVLTAHEIGHSFNATHADSIGGCGDTIMAAVVNNLTPVDFCEFSRGQIINFAAGNNSCLSSRASSRTPFDFDGDGRADIAVFRPQGSVWYISNSASGALYSSQFGVSTDALAPADYDGDGRTDVAVFRAGTWFRLKSSTNTFDGTAFGNSSDQPVPADYDGDGKADLAVFRPADGVWHRLLSANNAYAAVQFGANGDVPAAADYDGDDKADLAVFRPSNGTWFRLSSANGAFSAAQFGQSGDKALKGDFDGDGKSDVAVFRPASGGWFVLRSSDNSFMAATFGFSTDVPVPADYDGDSKTEIAVFRPSNGTWYRMNSSNNTLTANQFGADGDIPVAAYYSR